MADEQQMLDRRAELNRLAAQIQIHSAAAAARQTELARQQETVENLKSGLLNRVLNERFEINNKLKHTNDAQRRIRLRELAATDAPYQTALARLYALEEQKSLALAEAEYQRNLYRSTELLMLHGANQAA